jgi:hypothetical protein
VPREAGLVWIIYRKVVEETYNPAHVTGADKANQNLFVVRENLFFTRSDYT